jgi:succinoglycan biosynthesis transport protein ExoP
MSILQFLRILWAHRFITFAVTLATLVGAGLAILILPPSYQATTRVLLNILKPDPVTGQVIGTQSGKNYIQTQIEIIKDYSVAGRAVDKLGWASNPATIDAYNARTDQDQDLRRSLSQQIIDRTSINVPTSTNILEISFRSSSADDARSMANALRDAYIESGLEARREEATRTSKWFQDQAARERELLTAADSAKTKYEREIGIVMQDDRTDIETARLRSLSAQSSLGAPIVAPPSMSTSAAAMQLAQLDAQITQAAKTYGPNHPTMAQLKAQRTNLARVAADEQAAIAAQVSAATRAMTAGAGALGRAVSEQTNKVIANRDKIERLTQLQAQVNLHRLQMEKALERAASLTQEAAVADTGISVLSEAVTPRAPSFPNKPLILGGGAVLGFGIGLLLSLLLEFLNRKVRGAEDLMHGLDVPLLGIITSAKSLKKPRVGGAVRRRAPGRRRGPTHAA